LAIEPQDHRGTIEGAKHDGQPLVVGSDEVRAGLAPAASAVEVSDIIVPEHPE